jgi:DeoR family transcriptional regulator, aga operon transcriptional repressor
MKVSTVMPVSEHRDTAGPARTSTQGCAFVRGPVSEARMMGPMTGKSWRRSERVALILDHLDAVGSISVPELAEQFGVSLATVRRDLQMLEEQKLLERTHGGAVAAEVAHELPVRYRSGQRSQKREIARLAVSRVPMGAVVGLTGGSTTTEVARQLAVRDSLSVVTNALNIAAELALRPKFKIVVPGGVARPQSYELVGLWSDHALRVLNIGVAIVGVDGIDAEGGLTTHDEVEAQTNAALLSRARRVVVVADASKLGRVHLARIAGLDQVDEVITDSLADPAEVERLRGAGVTVTVAPPTRSVPSTLTVLPRPTDSGSGETA